MIRLKISLACLLILICSYAYAASQSADASFWDSTKTTTYSGELEPQETLTKNLSKRTQLMRLHHAGQSEDLTVHKLYTYSASDFVLYKKKVENYADEQLELGHWINSQVKKNLRNSAFVTSVDKFYHRLAEVAQGDPWLHTLQEELLSIRMDLPPETFTQYPDLESFIYQNYLYKHVPYHKHKLELDINGVPSLLVEGKMMPWPELKPLLQFDQNGVLTNYFYTYKGLVPGSPYETIVPFKKVNPNTYHHKHMLEVVSVDFFPPHNWIRLIDPEGIEYSVGFWSTVPLTNVWTTIQNLIPKAGRVASPDLMEIVGDSSNTLVTPIEISQDQFDQILAYLQEYQKDPKKYEVLSTLGGENCATFVRQVMEKLGFKIQTHSWIRPFNNPYDIMDWQAKIKEWRLEQLNALTDSTPEQRAEIEYSLPK